MFNQSIVLGNLFQDPVMRYTTGGLPIVNIRIGTNTYYVVNGEKQQKTESHDVFFTGKVAVNIEKYLNKGSLVFVIGEQSTSIQNDDVKGKIVHKKIKGHSIKFLDGKNKDHAYVDNNTLEQGNEPKAPIYNEYQRNNLANNSAPQPQFEQGGFAPEADFE